VVGEAVATGGDRREREVRVEQVGEGGVELRVAHRGLRGGARGQGARLSTKRQRSRTGHRSCLGFWAWQMTRPWWMSSTWAAYISSGSSSPRKRAWGVAGV